MPDRSLIVRQIIFGLRPDRGRDASCPDNAHDVTHFTSGFRGSPNVMRLPTASWFGNHFFANELLMIVTSGPSN